MKTFATHAEPDILSRFPSLAFPPAVKVVLAEELARKLQITSRQVSGLIGMGEIRAINIGDSNRFHWRIPVCAYKSFLSRRCH